MAEDSQDAEFLSLLPKLKILATDNSLGEKLDLKPVLSVAEDIIINMCLPKPLSSGFANLLGAYVLSHSNNIHFQRNSEPISKIAKMLEYPINYTSYVMTYWNCAGVVDPNSLTVELLKLLSNYSWDAKVVIAYAAFAINYSEFWLLHQLHQEPKNLLSDSIATLMGLPKAMLLGGQQLEELKAVLDVLIAGLKLTRCIIEFKDILSTDNISCQSPELVPTTVYWIIRSLVVCASTVTNLFAGTNAEAILSLARKLSAMLRPLQKQLKIFKEKVEDDNTYNVLESSMESIDIDNMTVLSALIRYRENERPLYNGAKRENEPLEVLRRKYVLLLISDLQLPQQEIHALRKINDIVPSKRHDYEVLWLPIVYRTTSLSPVEDLTFHYLRTNMPWYSVDHPTLVERPAIRYIRDYLHFMDKPMLLVLDPHGNLSHHDALPMMWIWGADAFPFTRDREIQLWSSSSDEDWNIDLLADSIDPRIPEWVGENKVICLYGGDDVDWIRNFTKSALEATSALNIPLEMLYVGTSSTMEKVADCHNVIEREKLSHILGNIESSYGYVWFWMRLNSMWISKKRITELRTVEGDKILRGIVDVLAFDSRLQGWALFSGANSEITMGNGVQLLPALGSYTQWADKVDHPDKFVKVLHKQLRDYGPMKHVTRLILRGDYGIPDQAACNECGKTMEMFAMYICSPTD